MAGGEITSSPATGAVPPTQVAPELQLPVAAEVMVAACRLAPASRKMERSKAERGCSCLGETSRRLKVRSELFVIAENFSCTGLFNSLQRF